MYGWEKKGTKIKFLLLKKKKKKKRENIWAKCTQIPGGSGEERTKHSLNKTQKYSEKLYM